MPLFFSLSIDCAVIAMTMRTGIRRKLIGDCLTLYQAEKTSIIFLFFGKEMNGDETMRNTHRLNLSTLINR